MMWDGISMSDYWKFPSHLVDGCELWHCLNVHPAVNYQGHKWKRECIPLASSKASHLRRLALACILGYSEKNRHCMQSVRMDSREPHAAHEQSWKQSH
jgi:hypothetical protein